MSTGLNSLHGAGRRGERLLHSRRRLLAVVAALLLLIGVVIAVDDPFAGNAPAGGGAGNGAPTGLATVVRRSLTRDALLIVWVARM